MELKIQETSLYNKWLAFTSNRAVVEYDFNFLKDEPVIELLGDFAKQKLSAFGEHASESVISFYSNVPGSPVDEVPVAWLDSEESPCPVVSKNLKDFLSVLPYGMGFVYTVAAVIEENMNDEKYFAKSKRKSCKKP